MQITKDTPPVFSPRRSRRARKYGEIYDAVRTLKDDEFLRVETVDPSERLKASLALRRGGKARGREMKIRQDPAHPLVVWASFKPIEDGTDA